MKDEIKEILERLDKGIKEVKFIRNPNFSEDKKYKEVGICLQEEQCSIFKDALDHITNLEKENKKLLKKSYSDDVRITKAIEYITSEEYFYLNNRKTGKFSEDSENYFKAHDKLLNILQGEDKE